MNFPIRTTATLLAAAFVSCAQQGAQEPQPQGGHKSKKEPAHETKPSAPAAPNPAAQIGLQILQGVTGLPIAPQQQPYYAPQPQRGYDGTNEKMPWSQGAPYKQPNPWGIPRIPGLPGQ